MRINARLSAAPLRAAALACAAAAGLAASAGRVEAGVPPLELTWTVDGNTLFAGTPSGVDVGNGTFRYQDSITGGGLTLVYSIIGVPDPLLSLGISLLNSSGSTIDVTVEAVLPIFPSLTRPTTLRGSAAYGLTTPGGGGTLGQIGDDPGWAAFADGVQVASLHNSLSLTVPSLGSIGLSENLLPGPGPSPVLDDIGVKASFSLTPGAQVSLTSVFSLVVPGPGAGLVLAAGAALTVRRRRRRT